MWAVIDYISAAAIAASLMVRGLAGYALGSYLYGFISSSKHSKSDAWIALKFVAP